MGPIRKSALGPNSELLHLWRENYWESKMKVAFCEGSSLCTGGNLGKKTGLEPNTVLDMFSHHCKQHTPVNK